MATTNPWGTLGQYQNYGNSGGAMYWNPQQLQGAGFKDMGNNLWSNGQFFAQTVAPNDNSNRDDIAMPTGGMGKTAFYSGDPRQGGQELRLMGDQATSGPFGSVQTQYDPTLGNYTTQDAFAQGIPYTGAGNSWYNQLAGYAPLILGGAMLGGGALAGIGDSAAGAGAAEGAAAGTAGAGTTAAGTGLDWAAIDAGEAVAPWTTNPSVAALGGSPSVAAGVAGAGGTSAATAAINQALGTKFTDGELAKLGLGAVQAGLGYAGSKEQTGTLQDIYNQQRADRAPALAAYNDALANPDKFYNSAPAMGAADAVLRKLSMQGNPAGNPGSLAQAAAYNLGGYNNYLSGLAGPAFGGQATQAQLGTNIASSQGGGLNAIGYGLGTALSSNPMDDYIKMLTNQGTQGYKYVLGP